MRALERPRRLPPNHRVVYDVVRAQRPGCHVPASEVFARARKLKPGLGHSTVYRALDRLCELGLILEVHVPGMNAALYESARSNHAHFLCRGCGALEDMEFDVPADEIGSSVAARGGEVNEISLMVHGRCAACRSPVGRVGP